MKKIETEKSGYTIPVTKDMAYARGTYAVSTDSARIVCRKLSRKKFPEAMALGERLLSKKFSIEGKYYTSAVDSIIRLLKLAENNANNKGVDTENAVLFVSAHQGPKMLRGRRKRMFGLKIKSTHIQAVLKPGISAEKKEKGLRGKIKPTTKTTRRVGKESATTGSGTGKKEKPLRDNADKPLADEKMTDSGDKN